MENYYLRPPVSRSNTFILWQGWPSRPRTRLFLVKKYHFIAHYHVIFPLVYLWSSPLPRRAVLFLVVDCDLRIRPVSDQEGARERLRDEERRVPREGGQTGLGLL